MFRSKPADEIPHSKFAAQAEAEKESEYERQKEAEAEAATNAFKPEFEQVLSNWNAFDLSTWRPGGMIHNYTAGQFLCIGKIEVPRQFIETITSKPEKVNGTRPDEPKMVPAEVVEYGSRERARFYIRKPYIVYPAQTVITIGLTSGRTESFKVRREVGELQLAHLQDIWKNG